MVVLKAFPLQFEAAPISPSPNEECIPREKLRLDDFTRSERVAQSKLKKYYGRIGFVPVPGTDYMVLDPNKGTGVLPTDNQLVAPPPRVNPSKRKPG